MRVREVGRMNEVAVAFGAFGSAVALVGGCATILGFEDLSESRGSDGAISSPESGPVGPDEGGVPAGGAIPVSGIGEAGVSLDATTGGAWCATCRAPTCYCWDFDRNGASPTDDWDRIDSRGDGSVRLDPSDASSPKAFVVTSKDGVASLLRDFPVAGRNHLTFELKNKSTCPGTKFIAAVTFDNYANVVLALDAVGYFAAISSQGAVTPVPPAGTKIAGACSTQRFSTNPTSGWTTVEFDISRTSKAPLIKVGGVNGSLGCSLVEAPSSATAMRIVLGHFGYASAEPGPCESTYDNVRLELD